MRCEPKERRRVNTGHMRTNGVFLAILFLVATPLSAESGTVARDGNIAIKEELDLALEMMRVDKLKLFIARHPDHPLVQDALHALATRTETHEEN